MQTQPHLPDLSAFKSLNKAPDISVQSDITSQDKTTSLSFNKALLAPKFKPKKIALLLPLTGSLASAGKAVLYGFMASYYAKNRNNKNETTQTITVIDTASIGAKSALDQAVGSQTDFIIGPLGRSAVKEVSGRYHGDIPWLLLNYDRVENIDSKVYHFGFSSENQTTKIAQQMWSSGYRHPLVIFDNSELGQRVKKQFCYTWHKLGGEEVVQSQIIRGSNENQLIADALLIGESKERANALQSLLLRKLDFTARRRQDIDIIFIKASAEQIRQIKPALNFYFARDIPVISLSFVYNENSNRYQNNDLDGLYFGALPWQLKPLPLMQVVKKVWSNPVYDNLNNLYAIGIDAGEIYPYLYQLKIHRDTFFYGYTGELFMDQQGNINRKSLNWVTFNKGHPAQNPLPNKALKQESIENE